MAEVFATVRHDHHNQGPYPGRPHHRVSEALCVAALIALFIGSAFLLGHLAERESEITEYDRAMYQWCLERPRVVDGRCAEVVAKMREVR